MSMPALAAATCNWNAYGMKAWPAEMKMMLPRVVLSCSNAARAVLNAPSRSMSITVLNPLGESFSAGQRKLPAARATTT